MLVQYRACERGAYALVSCQGSHQILTGAQTPKLQKETHVPATYPPCRQHQSAFSDTTWGTLERSVLLWSYQLPLASAAEAAARGHANDRRVAIPVEREGTAAANLQRGPCPVFQVARLQTDPPHRPPPSAAALGLGLGFGLGLGLGLGFGFGFGFRLAVPAAFASAAAERAARRLARRVTQREELQLQRE